MPKFTPRLSELVSDLTKGELSQEAFPFVNPPADAGAALRVASGAVPGRSARSAGSSVRSAASGATWARKGALDGRSGGASRGPRRLVIFVLGPISYTEIRAAHEAAASCGRDVLIGGTSVCSPDEFLTKLRALRGIEL